MIGGVSLQNVLHQFSLITTISKFWRLADYIIGALAFYDTFCIHLAMIHHTEWQQSCTHIFATVGIKALR